MEDLTLRRLAPAPIKRAAAGLLNALDPIALARYRRHTGLERPVPPRTLRARTGATSLDAFVTDGQRVATELQQVLADHALPVSEFESILDFGCGSGRVLVHLDCAKGDLAGSDVDRDAIRWLGRNFPIDARANDPQPPTAFGDASFQLVYAISVFTHLAERSQDMWLSEINRVLRPGGWGLLTVHGPELYRAFRRARRPGLTTKQLTNLQARDEVLDGFVFEPEPQSVWNAWRLGGVEREYGLAFHSPSYLRSHWSRFLEVVEVIPAALNWRQDAVLVRPREA